MLEVDIYFLDPSDVEYKLHRNVSRALIISSTEGKSSPSFDVHVWFHVHIVQISNRTLALLYLVSMVKVCKDGKIGIIGTDHSDYVRNRDVGFSVFHTSAQL